MAITTIATEEGLYGSSVQPHLPGHYLSRGAIIRSASSARSTSGRDGKSYFSSERFSLAHFRGCVLPHAEYL